MREQNPVVERALEAIRSICRTASTAKDTELVPPAPVPPATPAPPHDPAEWRAPFAEWLQSACVRHSRVSGGVRALHHAYCEWEIARGGVPCRPETFETLLREHGFSLRAFPGALLVEGLALWPDAERLAGLLQ